MMGCNYRTSTCLLTERHDAARQLKVDTYLTDTYICLSRLHPSRLDNENFRLPFLQQSACDINCIRSAMVASPMLLKQRRVSLRHGQRS